MNIWPAASLSSLAEQLSGECSRALSGEPTDLKLGHNNWLVPLPTTYQLFYSLLDVDVLSLWIWVPCQRVMPCLFLF